MKVFLYTTLTSSLLLGTTLSAADDWFQRNLGMNWGRIEEIQRLIENDIHATDELGRTALHMAAEWGYKTEMNFLITGGLSVTAKDNYDKTPLHYAVNRGRTQAAEVLIAFGADVNLRDDSGVTPLEEAIRAYNEEGS